MRVFAATFRDHPSAEAAELGLARALPLGADGVRLAALGRASDPNGPDTILAGRFEDDAMRVVREVVRQCGGTIVADLDEERTRD